VYSTTEFLSDKLLGRSASKIKALYTQLFYSAYVALTNADVHFDVIGVSIPNRVHDPVCESMQKLVNQLGFSFLVMDQDEWVKVADCVVEQLALDG